LLSKTKERVKIGDVMNREMAIRILKENGLLGKNREELERIVFLLSDFIVITAIKTYLSLGD
jgi:hypothetical protein